MDTVVRRLEEDLIRTRENLRATIEQHEISIEELKASNEELQAINEELRSASEELETSKEELQSVNEELVTVNSELKEKIEEATRANSDLQNLMASTDIATIFLDREMLIKRFTPLVQNFFNITALDIGRSLTHFTHSFEYEHLLTDAARVLSSLKTIEREIKDKDNQFYLMRVLPYYTADNRVDGVVLNFIDITKLKKAEENLLLSEEQLRRAIDEAPVPIIMQAEDGEVLQISRSWTELTGYEIAELPTLDAWLNHAYGEDAGALRDHMHQLFSGDKNSLNVEFMVRTRTGEHRFWNLSASSPGKLRDGRRFIIGIVEDITLRKNIEEEKNQIQEQSRLMVESAIDFAIFMVDENNLINSWNSGAEKIFGFKENEIIGKSGAILYTPEDREQGVPEREIKTAAERGRAEDERWHLRKDGSRFYASGAMMPLRGKKRGYLKIARDQTEKSITEKTVREKEMLSRIVAGQESERRRISRDIHDHLGQQLTALRLRLETIKQQCDQPEICDEISLLQEAVTKLDAEADFIAWELRPTALDDLGLRVALENFLREWSHHTKIQAHFHTSGLSRTPLDFDIETNLYRIAQEALNNIYKHAKAKTVSVLLEKRKDLIVLIIEDDGVGFNVNSKKIVSKGIGLSGMSERAKILGGELEIESEKGGGTTVYARIPLVNKI